MTGVALLLISRGKGDLDTHTTAVPASLPGFGRRPTGRDERSVESGACQGPTVRPFFSSYVLRRVARPCITTPAAPPAALALRLAQFFFPAASSRASPFSLITCTINQIYLSGTEVCESKTVAGGLAPSSARISAIRPWHDFLVSELDPGVVVGLPGPEVNMTPCHDLDAAGLTP